MSRGLYYNELLRPFDIRWFAGIGFWAGTAGWGLSIQRTARQGPFEPHEVKLMERLIAPLTHVATLSSAVGRRVLTGMTDALALCGIPVLALDRLGAVIAFNGLADALFDSALYVHAHRLKVADRAARRELDDLVQHIRSTPENAVVRQRPILVRRPLRSPVLIRVLPVPSTAKEPFLGARALLTLTVQEPPRNFDAALLTRVFGLSAAEARLAAQIADGHSLAEVAERSKLSIHTVRNQLKAVFAKAGVGRQSEFVALCSTLRGFPNA